MPYSSQYATCAGREIHYTEWGSQNASAVIAWHGLARTGRDMDELADHLSSRYRVICPDTIGRGLSQWSRDPHNEYTLAFYARLAKELFDHLKIDAAHWVGTSMGGSIGMVCAGGLTQPVTQIVRGRTHPSHARPLYARCPAATPRPTGHRPSFVVVACVPAPTSHSTTTVRAGYAAVRQSW